MSYAKIVVIGHVGSDPTTRKLDNGSQVANFSLAVNEYNPATKARDKVTWFRVDCWQSGETGMVSSVIPHVKKGGQIMVEGQPQLDQWTSKQTNERMAAIKIRIGQPGSVLQLCGRPAANGMSQPAGENGAEAGTSLAPGISDEVPF